MTRSRILSCLVAAGVAVTALAGTAAAAPAPTRYAALGDSYTASPLTGPLAGGPPGCLRSNNNYPHLVAKARGATLDDVSCSGATTRDFAAAQSVTGGSNPAQYGALKADTQLVSIGIGGNDIGFGDIVKNCISALPVGTPCKDRYTAGGTDQLRAKIATLGTTLGTVLREVHRRAPDADVLLVGYPDILPATGPGCYPALPYTPGDVAYLRGILDTLNSTIKKAAGSGDATYVDTYTPTLGHDVCQAPGTKWIEGLVPTAPAAPVHPNAQGAAAISRAVIATLNRS